MRVSFKGVLVEDVCVVTRIGATRSRGRATDRVRTCLLLAYNAVALLRKITVVPEQPTTRAPV